MLGIGFSNQFETIYNVDLNDENYIYSANIHTFSVPMGELEPYLAVLLIQLIYSGITLLSKAAFNGGMNTYVFVFYRQLVGTVILVPLAIICER